MMKFSQTENRGGRPCWNRDTQAQALRVELADGSSYLFPYARLAFVRFESGKDHDVLRVSLDTHDVQIVGKNLHQMELALQKSAVDWVRELPARYDLQSSDDSVWITSVTVTELQQ